MEHVNSSFSSTFVFIWFNKIIEEFHNNNDGDHLVPFSQHSLFSNNHSGTSLISFHEATIFNITFKYGSCKYIWLPRLCFVELPRFEGSGASIALHMSWIYAIVIYLYIFEENFLLLEIGMILPLFDIGMMAWELVMTSESYRKM